MLVLTIITFVLIYKRLLGEGSSKLKMGLSIWLLLAALGIIGYFRLATFGRSSSERVKFAHRCSFASPSRASILARRFSSCVPTN